MGYFNIKTLGGLVLAGALFTGPLVAQQTTFWRIGTGGSGGTYYPIGGMIANAISNPPGSRECDAGGSCGVPGLVAIAQSTNASVHNNSAVQAGGMEAGLTSTSTLYAQYYGEGDCQSALKFTPLSARNIAPLVLWSGRTGGAGRGCGGGSPADPLRELYSLFLNRQLSLPVSTISQ